MLQYPQQSDFQLILIRGSKKSKTQTSIINEIIPSVLAYVTSVSREIAGKYGNYQICNLRDCHGVASSINLYKNNVGKLQMHSVSRITKIKKTAITSTDGIRMATTSFTTIAAAAAGSSELDLFKDTKVADKTVTGTCLMVNDFNEG